MEAQLRSALAQAQRVDNAFECGQIHYNLSCMCVRSGSFKEAQTHAEDSIAACEKAMTQAPANIAAVKEVHVLACIGRALALVESQQFDIAEEACLETLTQAEDSFGPDNPHFIKTLRLCAMLQERQQNFDEAVAYLRRAIRSATNASNSRVSQVFTMFVVTMILHESAVIV
jgi:tetratricopeptide (TPR) repeat protein